MTVNTETGEIVEPLTAMERSELTHKEAVIERGLETFVEVGEALAEIRDRRLYRDQYGTFEAYCRERWNLSRSFAYETIEASETTRALSGIPDTPAPTNRGQARELSGLDPEDAADVMRDAHEQTDGKPTAKAIKQAREERKPDPDPKPTPSKPKRKPLPDSYQRALYDAKKRAESLIKLTEDDRYAANRSAVTAQSGPEALRTLLTIGAAVTQLDPATLAETEETRQWWLASLNEITDALQGFGQTLKES